MQIRPTNTTVSNLNINIILSPRLGLILLPNHLAVDALLIQPHPSLELVWHTHLRFLYIVCWIQRFFQVVREREYSFLCFRS